ncbi:NAD-dependent epimerase/dehydratase family protein [Sphaerisporangium album]|uniref:NAD-dependent epimerase/dehydratase family protein n=1 Tax=Sphaerisporangium album TaxID=509200 RepID=A0A367FR73_9ACTN|nr:NAD(P)H-binding protein [Sphaerisporangium album]RCG32878.1 NAD-dependent epimerase/dehydratase family protein [Sphaerisporangium album]
MFLVTGATGKVGGHAVSALLKEGARVRALTRDPGAARLPDGAEVVGGDLADPASLKAALDGVEAVLLVWPTLSGDHAAPETVAAIAGQVRHIVYLSARGVPDDRKTGQGFIMGSHARMEHLIEDSGAEWTFLRPTGFAANTLQWAEQIRETGTVHWAYGQAGRALIHERDIAAVGVRAMLDGGHAGAKHVLTGPRTLTQVEQVAAIGEAIGRPVRWVELTPEAVREGMIAGGLPPEMADAILTGHAAMAASPEPVTSTVEEITGAPATTYHQWARDHADAFR